MNKLKLLTDQAIGEGKTQKDDGLGFETYAKVLGNAALETPGPFTIGIFGEWGSGKTSLMMMTKEQLLNLAPNKDEIITVWFNAWQFEQEEHPVLPLIATIINEISQRKSVLTKGRESLLKALRAVVYGISATSKIKIPGFAEFEASYVAKDMIDRETQLSQDPLLDRSLYYNAFKTLEKVELDPDARIIVFIDDLDRCFPDKAIKLLESIKLILSQPGFIFFLGVERAIIEGYVRHLYTDEFGLKEFNKQSAYLDKIVQLPFPIPPHRSRMQDFSSKLLDGLKKLAVLEEDDIKGFKDILEIIGVACGSNPRSTVRFVNNLLIDSAINEELAEKRLMNKIPISYFAITRSLQQRWPEFYQLFVASSSKLLTSLANLAKKISNSIKLDALEGPDLEETKLKIIHSLEKDHDLRALLSSKQGKDWLENDVERQKAIDFLYTRRPEMLESENRYGAFLSYHSDDHEIVSQIVTILSTRGITSFQDTQLLSNDNVLDVFDTVFQKSKNLVVIIGSKWDETQWTQDQLVRARLQSSHRGLIVSVILSETEFEKIPPFLKNLPLIDLREQEINESTLQPLINALFV